MKEPGTVPSSRARAVAAAFALFDERGYDATTVDQIAERASISRSTFFRMFASKEEVIFPDHDDLQARIHARLAVTDPAAGLLALVDGARMVLEHFVAEGDLARARYRLTRTVPALRDREILGMAGYQRLFREFISSRMPASPGTELRSELMANAVVTAHNVVLRRWLRGLATDPYTEFEDAVGEVVGLFSNPAPRAEETTLLVLRSRESVDALLPRIRQALHEE